MSVSATAAESGGSDEPTRKQGDVAGEGAQRRFRVLIVEDELLTVLDIHDLLENEPFDITGEAGSAEDAVKAVQRHRPDLVLMDVRLNGAADGIDAALEIYRRFELRCVFATAHVDQHTRARAAPAHPLGWLAKPYKALQRTTAAAIPARRMRPDRLVPIAEIGEPSRLPHLRVKL
jgi:two-component system, response regulator PdtaR